MEKRPQDLESLIDGAMLSSPHGLIGNDPESYVPTLVSCIPEWRYKLVGVIAVIQRNETREKPEMCGHVRVKLQHLVQDEVFQFKGYHHRDCELFLHY